MSKLDEIMAEGTWVPEEAIAVTERDTAEAIAKWLETPVPGSSDDCEMGSLLKRYADAIRAGAWKRPPPDPCGGG